MEFAQVKAELLEREAAISKIKQKGRVQSYSAAKTSIKLKRSKSNMRKMTVQSTPKEDPKPKTPQKSQSESPAIPILKLLDTSFPEEFGLRSEPDKKLRGLHPKGREADSDDINHL